MRDEGAPEARTTSGSPRARSYFGEFDPFGDFDLLFGAARLGLKIVDLPVRYHPRTYGETNISRWRHGVLLLQMTVFAFWKFRVAPLTRRGSEPARPRGRGPRRAAALALAAALVVAALIVAAQPAALAVVDVRRRGRELHRRGAQPRCSATRVRSSTTPACRSTEVTRARLRRRRAARGRLALGLARAYVDRALLDLDRTRAVFRGLSGRLYLARRAARVRPRRRGCFGHWTLGARGRALLWLAAPGLLAMSIQLRPDVPLAVLLPRLRVT